MFNFYRKTADILVLLETHSTPENEKVWTAEWGGKAMFSHGTSAACGSCILFKKSFYCNVTNIIQDTNGRYVACDVETINSFKFALCAVYAPNVDSPSFFNNLEESLLNSHWNRLLIGDFNLVMDAKKDRYNSMSNNSKAQKKLQEMMAELSLSKTWRIHNPHEIRYSWRNNMQSSASRIDFFLISKAIEPLCEYCMYMQGAFSDHSAIFLTLKDTVHEKGPGYWKANTLILAQPEVKHRLFTVIEKTIGSENNR